MDDYFCTFSLAPNCAVTYDKIIVEGAQEIALEIIND